MGRRRKAPPPAPPAVQTIRVRVKPPGPCAEDSPPPQYPPELVDELGRVCAHAALDRFMAYLEAEGIAITAVQAAELPLEFFAELYKTGVEATLGAGRVRPAATRSPKAPRRRGQR